MTLNRFRRLAGWVAAVAAVVVAGLPEADGASVAAAAAGAVSVIGCAAVAGDAVAELVSAAAARVAEQAVAAGAVISAWAMPAGSEVMAVPLAAAVAAMAAAVATRPVCTVAAVTIRDLLPGTTVGRFLLPPRCLTAIRASRPLLAISGHHQRFPKIQRRSPSPIKPGKPQPQAVDLLCRITAPTSPDWPPESSFMFRKTLRYLSTTIR